MSTLSVRRPLSVLAVLAMVATLLFAVAGTASAATVEPSDEAVFSACPDNANIPDAGFSDIPTASFFDDSVNCLAYYAVTLGTTLTTYGPADDVTRSQMAVFLYRMAPVAGVVLSATPPDAGFNDISGLSAEAQLAINSLAAKGIVKGKTTTTYEPADTVWRQQMALFLTRFSDAASAPTAGPGGTQAKDVTGTTNNFTDIGGVTVEADDAITEVFHLGVADGTTETTYDPLGNVNRGQMSLFLTRLAAHMNVRPAGVNLQVEPMSGFADLSVDAAATVRNSDFTADADEPIDIFSTEDPAGAFTSGGACILSEVGLVFGGTVCAIDGADPDSDTYGNFEFSDTVGVDELTYYAWSGGTGDTFDEDTTQYSDVEVTTSEGAADVEWTTTTKKFAFDGCGSVDGALGVLCGGEFAKYGTTVIISAQLVDADGDPVAEDDVEMQLDVARQVNFGANNFTTYKVKTDATGKAEFPFTETDPNDEDYNDDDATVVNVFNAFDVEGNYANTWLKNLSTVWDDDKATENEITIDEGLGYSRTSSASVKAFVYDQYGIGMSGVDVDFNTPGGTCGANATPAEMTLAATMPVTRETGTSGATTGQPMTNTNQTCDVITADIVGGGAWTSNTDVVEFFWTEEVPDQFFWGATVEVWDGDAETMVIDAFGQYWWATYDANDVFELGGANKSFSAFDKAVKAEPDEGMYSFLTLNPYDTSTSSISEFWLN